MVQTLACVKAVVKKLPKNRENTLTTWYSGKKGITGYLFQGRYISKVENIHFHLQRECLRHHDDTIQLCQIMMHEEVFEELSIEQMSVLNKKGFLKYITANFEVFNL